MTRTGLPLLALCGDRRTGRQSARKPGCTVGRLLHRNVPGLGRPVYRGAGRHKSACQPGRAQQPAGSARHSAMAPQGRARSRCLRARARNQRMAAESPISRASLGWSQNINHVRLERPLTADLRDPIACRSEGRLEIPFAHAADIRPARSRPGAPHIALHGDGPCRLGHAGALSDQECRFLRAPAYGFPVDGATPASGQPGIARRLGAAPFTFDPLHRGCPAVLSERGSFTRSAFANAPWQTSSARRSPSGSLTSRWP